MYITLKMEIQEEVFTLDLNLANRAGRIYRQQFERDILKDMSDLYRKLHRNPLDIFDLTGFDAEGKTEEEIHDELMSRVNVDKLMTFQSESIPLDFEETERAGQIIWAFAKNRKESIPSYEDWIDEFDFVLPVEKIIPALYEAWGKSAKPIIELKN